MSYSQNQRHYGENLFHSKPAYKNLQKSMLGYEKINLLD